ncbi:TetR family transcriptional regulator C-terminal domain-containing protein [Algoriphagus sp. CAU 1675]|uniref:TetR/AcrR family transcriptional regulator n=1 Tax=Algoriphagus sp. CAU 1675 TaxID=3032597 RepID=UPI0023DCC1D5|nr:TetR family transcriptional regulator C-terminal domain-containing protein [Algoriphagus sp. CAU 1675]MDF2158283.1 TetR family transcriptional regulator C-terminal domain-containing protein [Algoriphagus sp. CAU 1675]
METKTAKKTTKKDYGKLIVDAFVEQVLETGNQPTSIFKFAQSLKMKEGDFYAYFTSFEAIKSAILLQIFEEARLQLESQEVFKEYSAREKFLGFLFTWVEVLKTKRSYLLSVYGQSSKIITSFPSEFREFRKKFKEFAADIILEGKETQEIANRPFISDRYDEALWLQVLFVFKYWLEDHSPRFEKTDAAIEKSVNLAFDLMGQSALDSFLDFAKFMYQNK